MPKASKSGSSAKPAATSFEDFSDLDAILDGTGDTAPIMVPVNQPSRPAPTATQPQDVESGQVATSESAPTERPRRKPSSGAFVCSVIAGTLGIWLGSMLVYCRFKPIEQFPFAGFSNQLRCVYTGQFGMLDVPGSIQSVFIVLGWALWVTGLMLVLLGTIQLANSFIQILIQKPLARWSNSAMTGVAFLAVVLGGCLVFTQSTLQNHLHGTLEAAQAAENEEEEAPAPDGIDELEFEIENDTLLRLTDEFSVVQWNFNTAIFAQILGAMTIFVCALVATILDFRT